jgi:hypothetical protein
LIRGLGCPYRRFQSTWDHVHGSNADLAIEMARAAAAGACPRVRLMDAAPPFDDVAWGPPTPMAQGGMLVRWALQATYYPRVTDRIPAQTGRGPP